MLNLLKSELETNSAILNKGLIAFETDPADFSFFDEIIRAVHSIKGAAKILGFDVLASFAGAFEDYFEELNKSKNLLDKNSFELLFTGVEILNKAASEDAENIPAWLEKNDAELKKLTTKINNPLPISQAVNIKVIKDDADPKQKTDTKPAEENKKTNIINDIDPSMLELFITELENNALVLNDGLLELEKDNANLDKIEDLMRASHSIKGAARILNISAVVKIAHLMEDYFIAVKENRATIKTNQIDVLLSSVDLFSAMAASGNLIQWINENSEEFGLIELQLSKINVAENGNNQEIHTINEPKLKSIKKEEKKKENKQDDLDSDRILRVSAENINRLVGFASESLITSRNTQKYVESIAKVQNLQNDLGFAFDRFLEVTQNINYSAKEVAAVNKLQQIIAEFKKKLTEYNNELEVYTSKSVNISNRLYKEVLLSRMRPFEDGVSDFPRMVRDISKQLGKKNELEIIGKNTKVDRDILEKLKSPLTHILRNAIDHGIEFPQDRINNGKNEEGKIILTAMHSGGMLLITIEDDGRGIDFNRLSEKIISKNYITKEIAANLSQNELIDFLFLPGFSTAASVTEVSGRGVGLDVVQNMVQEVNGIISVETNKGKGSKFILKLPITLSVLRTLIIWAADEPYAFPLTRIEQTLIIPQNEIQSVEGKQYINLNGTNVGLVHLLQILGKTERITPTQEVYAVVISDRINKYAIVVDKFEGEQDLVVHRLDPRLGKIKDISTASLLDNGEPVLIFDVEDLIRSIDDIITGGRLKRIAQAVKANFVKKKRILVVDDSVTVREVERKLLLSFGYEVDTAINGVDGWNFVRGNDYDLIISDIDMPRMNGLEFTALVKGHEKYKNIPVIIVSYKDRQEDKLKGLEAGANYYLTKSSFNDDTFINSVKDLIGESNQ